MPKLILLLPWILLILPGFLQAESFVFPYRPYTSDHMDIGFKLVHDPEEDALVLRGIWLNDSATVEGVINSQPLFLASELRALGVFDDPALLIQRPASVAWDFIGVQAGERFYNLPSNVNPLLPFLGFSTEHPSLSTFSTLRITLVNMQGPSGGHFSLHTGPTNVTMQTWETFTFPAGTLEMEPGDHFHFNWSFSKPGTYDLTFLFEILEGDTVLHSGTDTFRFQITEGEGYANYEHWRRTHFHPGDVNNDAISGPEADAGAVIGRTLGFTNARRFAFGNAPSVNFRQVEINSVLYPAVEMPLRQNTGGLNTFPETATNLLTGDWTALGLTEVESERVSFRHDPGLERRLYRLNTPAVPGPRFFRATAERR